MKQKIREPFQYKKINLRHAASADLTITGRQKGERTKNWWATILRIWSYLSNRKGKLFLVLSLVVISSVLALLGPYLVGTGIDNFIVEQDKDGLISLIILLIVIYIFLSLSTFLQNIFMIEIAQSAVFKMRTSLFHHLHKLPIPFFDKRQHGELMSRVTNDIENVSSTLNSSVIQVFSSLLTLIGTVAVMLYLSPILTAVTLTIIPAMFFGLKWITSRTGKLFKEQQRRLGNLNGHIQETLSNQRIVKTFSQEEKVIEQFKEKNKRLKQSGFWAQTFSGFIPKLMNVLNNLSYALIAGVGGILALKGIVSIGTIVIFVEYARQFTRPLSDLANQFNTLLSAIAGAERVFVILDEEEETKDEEDAVPLEDVVGEVIFDRVSFSYEGDGDTVSQISFQAHPGETIAFVGPTGAGKTTLINLLSRFYNAESGRILIDGQDTRSLKRESMRKHMGFVLQDSFLFQGTIRENIRYGRLNASDEEVIEAAKLANAYSFIMKLPNGFDTVLDAEGRGISQGQRQLLSIARALVANPKILILDEATSSIDTITELKIQEALQRLMKGRTSFVIAHRLNTIQQADKIIILHEGEIIEKGDHESLLKKDGFYANLYHSQLKKEALLK